MASRADVPIALHLDHLTDDDLVAEAVRGPLRPYVSSLMYDGGALPYAENLARTKQVVDDGHAAGLWVEAELGYVGGQARRRAERARPRRPDRSRRGRRVRGQRPGVDALAVAVGSSHAMTTRTARLDHRLIAALRCRGARAARAARVVRRTRRRAGPRRVGRDDEDQRRHRPQRRDDRVRPHEPRRPTRRSPTRAATSAPRATPCARRPCGCWTCSPDDDGRGGPAGLASPTAGDPSTPVTQQGPRRTSREVV